MSISLKSTAFEDGGALPRRYTCDGRGISPPLSWTGVPPEAKSVALVLNDPDAPSGTFTHWVIFNIPGGENSLSEGIPTDKTLSIGAEQGVNSANKIGYIPPCPPRGTHRYIFHIYALDAKLELPPVVGKNQLMNAMEGHILAEGELMGTYSR